jgi:hypothetical protein
MKCCLFRVAELTSVKPAASVSLLDFEGADHVNLGFCLSAAITKTVAAGGIEGFVCE